METVNYVHLFASIFFNSIQTILAAIAVIYMLVKPKSKVADSADSRVPASTWLQLALLLGESLLLSVNDFYMVINNLDDWCRDKVAAWSYNLACIGTILLMM